MRLFSVIAPSLSLILRTVSRVRESSRSGVGTNGEQCGKERKGVPHSPSFPSYSFTLLSFPLFLGNLEEDTGSEREILQGKEPKGREREKVYTSRHETVDRREEESSREKHGKTQTRERERE